MQTLVSHLRPFVTQIDKVACKGRRAVVGLDGFVDEMITVVDHRVGVNDWVPIRTIAQLGAVISAAAGKSFGREILVKSVESGGNAPNLAEGLIALGFSVDFYGTLGQPRHPVFDPFAASCRSCTSIGTGHGRTLALEFDDGKLMLNETSQLASLDAACINAVIELSPLASDIRAADLIGLANWSRYPHMTDCWNLLCSRVLSSIKHRPWLIIDLADPSVRSSDDIRGMLAAITAFQAHARTVLGVNLNESSVLLKSLGHAVPANEPESMKSAAAALRSALNIELVVIHSQRRAAASTTTGAECVEGAYNAAPVRTTGVGDRFNAGLALGLLADLPARGALALGCLAASIFVTTGKVATAQQIIDLCRA